MQRVAAAKPAWKTTATGEDAGDRPHLLRRFWRSAGGFWGRQGWRLAWVLCTALVSDRPSAPRRHLWHERLASRHFRRVAGKGFPSTVLLLSALYLPLLAGSVALSIMNVFARMTLQRRLARVAQRAADRSLAQERPALPARPGDAGAHQESEVSASADDVRIATRGAGRACDRL